MSHTPAPWFADPLDENYKKVHMTKKHDMGRNMVQCVYVSDEEGGGGDGVIVRVYGPNCEVDADFIVTACNSFEAMRDALEKAKQFIRNGIECDFIRMPDGDDPAHKTLPMIEAALKLSKGEQP